MQTIKLQQFKYTRLDGRDDVTSMPLIGNLFGINNKIYANMGSYGMSDEEHARYLKHYSADELRYRCLNRLFEVEINTRTHDDDYGRMDGRGDFADVYKFVKEKHDELYSIHASYRQSDRDGEEKGAYEKTILYIPLGSDVIFQACNYAYQEIERIKLENFVDNNLEDSKHVNNFLNLF